MRKLRWFIALGALASLIVCGFLTFDLFAQKPADDQPEVFHDPCVITSLGKVTEVAMSSRSESACKLPVTRVVLFNSGVAYFERQGDVEGDTHIDLSFPVQDINDMLKSMVVQDLGGGHISAISFDSQAPVEKTLHSFAIDLSGAPTFAEILQQARGERVEIVLQQSNTTQPGTMTGAIVGLEKHPQVVTVKEKEVALEEVHLNLWCAEGMRSVKLSDVQRIRFLNPVMESEFKKALEVVTQGHDKEKKSVSLNCTGNGQRTVKVGYVVENPIWKTSYRLVLDKKEKPFLQGWAVVENSTDEDWNDVAIDLVSGRPISFSMDLYQPLNVPRPRVEPELFASLRPQTYGDGSKLNFAVGLAPSACAPAMPCATSAATAQSGSRQGSFLAGGEQACAESADVVGIQGVTNLGVGRAKRAEQVDLTKGVASAANAVNLGDFFSYEIDHSVSLGRQKSAMLPIINQAIDASRVSIYNERVHGKFPLLGLKFKNNTDMHLNQGPITIFDGDSYAGDARILDLQPKEERLISYAIDLGTEVVPVASSDNGKRTSVKIMKGVIHTTTRTKETKTYTITNRSDQDRTVLVEHPYRSDFKLVDTDKPEEIASDVYRFAVKVEAGKTAKHVVTEERNDGEQIAINNSDDGRIQIIMSDPAASKDIKDALRMALEKKLVLAKTLEEIGNHQREQDRIKNEQPRLRENLKVLPQSDPLVKKIQEKLLAQENEIEKHETDINKLQAKADQQRKEFETYLSGLTVEK